MKTKPKPPPSKSAIRNLQSDPAPGENGWTALQNACQMTRPRAPDARLMRAQESLCAVKRGEARLSHPLSSKVSSRTPVLPHECGGPPAFGTPHLCGSQNPLTRHQAKTIEYCVLQLSLNYGNVANREWAAVYLRRRKGLSPTLRL